MANLRESIKREVGDNDPKDVTSLCVTGISCDNLEGFDESLTSLEHLSLPGLKLSSLTGFPSLPVLKELDLAHNQLKSGLENLAKCTELECLNLSDNAFDSAESLAPLSKIASLRVLTLDGCPLTKPESYRDAVFAAISQLEVADGLTREGEEVELDSDDDTGDSEDDYEEEGEGESEEEEIGIEVLQRTEDLEDEDEEDYVPVDGDKSEDDDDEEEEEAEDVDVADLSHEQVAGKSRAAAKRTMKDTADAEDIPPAKVAANGNQVNGSVEHK